MNKASFYILLLLFAYNLTISGFEQVSSTQYWIRRPSPTTKDLQKCFNVDSLFCWAAGDSGIVINTTNGGSTWNIQQSGINSPINDIYFLNRTQGWAVSYDYTIQKSFILKTTNGGTNWSVILYPDSTIAVASIYFIDSFKGLLGSDNGKIFETTNSGNTWTESRTILDTNLCFPLPVFKIRFADLQTGYACGGGNDIGGRIWKTTDGGNEWHMGCPIGVPLYDIVIYSPGIIYSAGGEYDFLPGFLTTGSGGNTWKAIYLDTIGIGVARSLAFRTRSEIWMPMGGPGKWALSIDTGNTWIPVGNTDTALNAACFLSPVNGYTFGAFGSIYKYNTSIIGIIPVSSIIPGKFSLFQNYPNPFNPSTKIKFSIPYRDKNESIHFIRLKIYNVLGKEMETIMNKSLKPGSYEVEWDGTKYPSGVYFYELSSYSGGSIIFSETKKMVLLK